MILSVLLPLALAGIMFVLGLSLVPADFLRLFTRPWAVSIGLLGQVALLPVMAYGVARSFGLSGEMAVGVMILAACPGGASSGLLTMLARGDTALSITLTAISSLLAAVSLPLIVSVSLQQFMDQSSVVDIPVGSMARGVFLLTTVPVALGMALRHFKPVLTTRIEPAAGKLATALFVLIVIATFVGQRTVIIDNLPAVGPAMIVLNLLAMGMGFGLAALSGLARSGRIAIAMECGLQNAGLGIFVAMTVLQTPALSVPIVVYALLMNFGAIALVLWMRRVKAN
jgi:BASS family bile acid:Na+ symporter